MSGRGIFMFGTDFLVEELMFQISILTSQSERAGAKRRHAMAQPSGRRNSHLTNNQVPRADIARPSMVCFAICC
jgi:hypothetical protein